MLNNDVVNYLHMISVAIARLLHNSIVYV